jgi:hypothetical protein
MELTINGTVYRFKFGIGFMRDINKDVQVPVDGAPGVKRDTGLAYNVARAIDGDVDALINILLKANKGFEPRLTQSVIDDYIDREDTDIDQLSDTVIDFLRKSNATKKQTESLLKIAEESETENGK